MSYRALTCVSLVALAWTRHAAAQDDVSFGLHAAAVAIVHPRGGDSAFGGGGEIALASEARFGTVLDFRFDLAFGAQSDGGSGLLDLTPRILLGIRFSESIAWHVGPYPVLVYLPRGYSCAGCAAAEGITAGVGGYTDLLFALHEELAIGPMVSLQGVLLRDMVFSIRAGVRAAATF